MNEQDRQYIAESLRSVFPWLSAVPGARGCRFLLLDRGEIIVGSRTRTDEDMHHLGTSVWTRPVDGSRNILWQPNLGGPRVFKATPPMFGQAGRMTLLHQDSAIRIRGRGWREAAIERLRCLCEDWLRPVPEKDIAQQLRRGERFEIRLFGENREAAR